VQPREQVEVEASDAHNRIVGVPLVRHHKIGYGVPHKSEIVVIRGTDGPEEGGTCGEEGNILDIRIMFLRYC
jgi:hypothetical protein